MKIRSLVSYVLWGLAFAISWFDLVSSALGLSSKNRIAVVIMLIAFDLLINFRYAARAINAFLHPIESMDKGFRELEEKGKSMQESKDSRNQE